MTLPTLPAEGGCRCGGVRFRIAAPPLFTAACHCTGCQHMTGSAYSLTAAVPDAGFEQIAGETVPGGADHAYGHRFCPDCLSWVWTKSPRMDGFLNLRASLFDDTSWIAPFVETWTTEKLGFAVTGAPRSYPEFPAMADLGQLLQDYQTWARD